MKKKMTTYTPDFKNEAVELGSKIGITKAGTELGINPANIRRWRDAGGMLGDAGALPVDSKDIDWEKEAKKLRKEVQYLKIINDVLKKSTAIFSQDDLPPLK